MHHTPPVFAYILSNNVQIFNQNLHIYHHFICIYTILNSHRPRLSYSRERTRSSPPVLSRYTPPVEVLRKSTVLLFSESFLNRGQSVCSENREVARNRLTHSQVFSLCRLHRLFCTHYRSGKQDR